MMNQNDNDWEQQMPAEFQSALNRVRSNPVPEESVERFLKLAGGIEMTASEWRRGGFPKWIWIAALLSLGVPMLVAAPFLLVSDARVGATIGAGVVAALVFICFFWNWMQSKRNAGAILLDCGAFPSRVFFMFLAALCLVLTIYSVIFALHHVSNILSREGAIASVWIGLCVAVLVSQIMTILGRLQFRTHGIWCYVGLIRWEQIVSWNWTGSNQTTLFVQRKSWWGTLATGAVPIPLELKDEVEELMTIHASATDA